MPRDNDEIRGYDGFLKKHVVMPVGHGFNEYVLRCDGNKIVNKKWHWTIGRYITCRKCRQLEGLD